MCVCVCECKRGADAVREMMNLMDLSPFSAVSTQGRKRRDLSGQKPEHGEFVFVREDVQRRIYNIKPNVTFISIIAISILFHIY